MSGLDHQDVVASGHYLPGSKSLGAVGIGWLCIAAWVPAFGLNVVTQSIGWFVLTSMFFFIASVSPAIGVAILLGSMSAERNPDNNDFTHNVSTGFRIGATIFWSLAVLLIAPVLNSY